MLLGGQVSSHCVCRMKPSKTSKSDDPEKGMLDLMKKMYEDGDDEMRRLIKKAWHESYEKKMSENL